MGAQHSRRSMVALSACSGIRDHRGGFVGRPTLAEGIQVGKSTISDLVTRTMRPPDLHRPVRSQRLVLCVARRPNWRSVILQGHPADGAARPVRPGRRQRHRRPEDRVGQGADRHVEPLATRRPRRKRSFSRSCSANIGTISWQQAGLLEASAIDSTALVAPCRSAVHHPPAPERRSEARPALRAAALVRAVLIMPIIHRDRELWLKQYVHEGSWRRLVQRGQIAEGITAPRVIASGRR